MTKDPTERDLSGLTEDELYDLRASVQRATPPDPHRPPSSVRSNADAEHALGMIAAGLRNPAPLAQRAGGPPADDAQKLLDRMRDELRPTLEAAGYNVTPKADT